MAERTLAGLGLKGDYADDENGWGPGMRSNLVLLSALLGGQATSITAELDVSPVSGTILLLDVIDEVTPTNVGDIAIFDGPTGEEDWIYITPPIGTIMMVGDVYYRRDYGPIGGTNYWMPLRLDFDIPVELPFWFDGTPGADEVIGRFVFARDIQFGADFESSAFGSPGIYVADAPTATYEIEVYLEAGPTLIGSLSINTGGVPTWVTVDNEPQFVSAFQPIIMVCQTTPDATISDIRGSILATANPWL